MFYDCKNLHFKLCQQEKIPLTNQKYYDKIIPIAHDKKRARKRKTNKKGNIGNVHYGK